MIPILSLFRDFIVNKKHTVEEASHIIRIGVPTHFRPTNENVSACGIECPEYAAYDGRDVDCIRCRKTKVWKEYVGKIKGTLL